MKDERINEKDRTECKRCGREVSVKWNFCPKCGNQIQERPVIQTYTKQA